MRRFVVAAMILLVVSCEREERRFREMPARTKRERLVNLVPGPYTPDVYVQNPYARNAFAVSEGKRLYNWWNCVGCHANGGGGMGPPLMDARWIYGADPEQIFASIVEGRPNGMPSYMGKMPDYEVWQLVAYIQSLSGNIPKDAATGRSDHMQVRKQEQSLPRLPPKREPARHP